VAAWEREGGAKKTVRTHDKKAVFSTKTKKKWKTLFFFIGHKVFFYETAFSFFYCFLTFCNFFTFCHCFLVKKVAS
jgi:hypothetical protein